MNVLAVDPGLTTGVAALSNGNVTLTEVRGQISFLERAEAHIAFHRPIVVVEAYIITATTAKLSRQYEPLEIIGALRWMAHKKDVGFVMQTPRQAKDFSTDDKLKAVGWYEKGIGHGNDAARHLLLYMVTQVKDPDLIERILNA